VINDKSQGTVARILGIVAFSMTVYCKFTSESAYQRFLTGFYCEAFFFVAAAAYSQLFCGLLGKYLLMSELDNIAHIIT